MVTKMFCYYKVFSNYLKNVILQQKHVFPTTVEPQTPQTQKKNLHSRIFNYFFFPPKFWEWSISSTRPELTASSRRRPDGRSSSAAIQVAAQGRPRCIFQTPAAKRLDSVPSITSCSCQASRQWTQPSGLELCACVLFKGRVMMSVIHREHAPSPDWKTRGCKHQRRALRSMLPFMKSFCLLIVPCAWPASLLLLIPTPQQCHNSPTTITQQSHSSPPRRLLFFL